MTHGKIALGTTFILWTFFFLAVFFIPMPAHEEEKREFGEVSIRLDPLPQKTTFVPPAPTPQTEIEPEQVPESSQKTSAPSKTTPQETPSVPAQSTSSPPAPAPVKPQVLSKSIEELMAEAAGTTQPKSTTEWDDSIFDNSSTKTSGSATPNNPPQNTAESSSTLSGSAGTAANSNSNETVARGQTSRSNSDASSGIASTETSDALAKIGEVGSLSTSNSGVYSANENTGMPITNTGSVQGNPDSISIAFADGKDRKALTSTALTISEKNEKLINSSRKLEVSIEVSADGNVKFSSITFTPSALLPLEIQSELRQQISQWRFEPGGDGQATFIYSIIYE